MRTIKPCSEDDDMLTDRTLFPTDEPTYLSLEAITGLPVGIVVTPEHPPAHPVQTSWTFRVEARCNPADIQDQQALLRQSQRVTDILFQPAWWDFADVPICFPDLSGAIRLDKKKPSERKVSNADRQSPARSLPSTITETETPLLTDPKPPLTAKRKITAAGDLRPKKRPCGPVKGTWNKRPQADPPTKEAERTLNRCHSGKASKGRKKAVGLLVKIDAEVGEEAKILVDAFVAGVDKLKHNHEDMLGWNADLSQARHAKVATLEDLMKSFLSYSDSAASHAMIASYQYGNAGILQKRRPAFRGRGVQSARVKRCVRLATILNAIMNLVGQRSTEWALRILPALAGKFVSQPGTRRLADPSCSIWHLHTGKARQH